jgi:hypothetical protein
MHSGRKLGLQGQHTALSFNGADGAAPVSIINWFEKFHDEARNLNFRWSVFLGGLNF